MIYRTGIGAAMVFVGLLGISNAAVAASGAVDGHSKSSMDRHKVFQGTIDRINGNLYTIKDGEGNDMTLRVTDATDVKCHGRDSTVSSSNREPMESVKVSPQGATQLPEEQAESRLNRGDSVDCFHVGDQVEVMPSDSGAAQRIEWVSQPAHSSR